MNLHLLAPFSDVHSPLWSGLYRSFWRSTHTPLSSCLACALFSSLWHLFCRSGSGSLQRTKDQVSLYFNFKFLITVTFSGPQSVFSLVYMSDQSWIMNILFQCRITGVDSNERDRYRGRAFKYLIEFRLINLWNFLHVVIKPPFLPYLDSGAAAGWLFAIQSIKLDHGSCPASSFQ